MILKKADGDFSVPSAMNGKLFSSAKPTITDFFPRSIHGQ